MNRTSALSQEWCALQRDYEHCERSALWIKLAAILLSALALAVAIDILLVCGLIAILWVQEAIVRTGQTRMGNRLLEIEALLRQLPVQESEAYQLHSQWQSRRGGSLALLAEYAASCQRPTVAFPYVALLLLLVAALSTTTG